MKVNSRGAIVVILVWVRGGGDLLGTPVCSTAVACNCLLICFYSYSS